jgi:hypothetical protein
VADDAQLAQLAAAGVPYRPIAQALGRSHASIMSRAKILGVPLVRTSPTSLRASVGILATQPSPAPQSPLATFPLLPGEEPSRRVEVLWRLCHGPHHATAETWSTPGTLGYTLCFTQDGAIMDSVTCPGPNGGLDAVDKALLQRQALELEGWQVDEGTDAVTRRQTP